MGDIKRKQKLYSKPRRLYDRARIDEENALIKKYGLKNKREIWKAKSEVSKIRRRAKELISAEKEEQQKFFDKLNKIGLKIKDIADVLALTEENWLDRRLQTFVFNKKLANTSKQARQLIVHKYVLVNEKVVNTPSFVVPTEMENKLTLKVAKPKILKSEEKIKEKIKEEVEPVKEESETKELEGEENGEK